MAKAYRKASGGSGGSPGRPLRVGQGQGEPRPWGPRAFRVVDLGRLRARPVVLRPRLARPGLLVGTAALTAGATLGALGIGAVPAYASVTTRAYTIGTPSRGVADLSVSPATAGRGAPTSFEVRFKAGAELSGGDRSWISVAPSEPLGSVPASVDLISGSCLQAGVSGAGGAGTVSATGMTVEVASSCTIGAQSTVQVDFTADAPDTAGTFTFTVTTSANATAATSNGITVSHTGPSLSASTYRFGANATFFVSHVPVAGLSANTSQLTLRSVPTSGSAPVAFYRGATGYHVSYTAPGSTAESDPVSSATGSSGAVTLDLADSLANGGAVSLTLIGTNPPDTSGPHADAFSVQPGNGTVETTNAVTFGNSVAAVKVVPSSPVAGASSTYNVSFLATNAMSAGGDVVLSEPSTNFASVTGVLVTDTARHWEVVATGETLRDGSATIPVPDPVGAGDPVSLVLVNVTNPPAGTIGDFAVTTSSDQVAAYGAPYTIGANASSGAVVTVDPSTAGSLATYTISDLRATAALVGGTSTIGIDAPSGTVFPDNSHYYALQDSTRASGSGPVAALVSGGGTNDVTVTVSHSVVAGDQLTVDIEDVVNPSRASSTYAIALSGDVTGAPPVVPKPVPKPKPKPKPAPHPAVDLLTARALYRDGRVSVRVRCTGRLCRGTALLVDVRTGFASRPYTLRAGEIGTLTFGIDKAGRFLIGHAREHIVTVREVVTVDGGRPAERKVTLIG